MRDRQRDERRGRLAEALAALALQVKGYRILARRWRTPVGEIDLIAARAGLVAFVEVKARTSVAAALAAIPPAAQRRQINAARAWLARQSAPPRVGLRFDLVIVTPRRWPLHIRDVFRPEADHGG